MVIFLAVPLGHIAMEKSGKTKTEQMEKSNKLRLKNWRSKLLVLITIFRYLTE